MVGTARSLVICFATLLAFLSTVITAADEPHPLQPSDTSSPRATLNSFIDACNELFDLVGAEQRTDEDTAKFLAATEQLHDLYLAATKRQPTPRADTSSPRGTLTLFIDSANEIYEAVRTEKHFSRNDPRYLPITTRISSCLDLSELPEYSRNYYAGEAAVCLKEVLDRVTIPSPEKIPGAESIEGPDGEKLIRWKAPNTPVTIARVQEGPLSKFH